MAKIMWQCKPNLDPAETGSGSRIRSGRTLRLSSARRFVVGLVALASITGCGAQNYAQPATPCAAPNQADALADQLLRLINLERTLADLGPLSWDDELAKVSQAYACRMIEGEFFGHVDPETQAAPNHRLTLAGYEFVVMGENLAQGQTTAAEVLDSWLASPAHRDNLMSPDWTHIGIGVRTDDDGTLHWVLEFADPA
ncbi:MAG: CAP domain-containing protein [bacterium]|nr:CAP domain-containing protein [bacterium]